MPDGPVSLVGDGREFPAGIDCVSVAHGEKEIPVEQAVTVRVGLSQVQAFALREAFDRARFGGTIKCEAIQVAGPSTAVFLKARGTDERLERLTTSFEFAGKCGDSEICKWLPSAGDQDDGVTLGEGARRVDHCLFEERDGVHVSKNQVARNVRQVALIAMLNGKRTLPQKSQRFRDPTEIVGQRNFVVAAQFAK